MNLASLVVWFIGGTLSGALALLTAILATKPAAPFEVRCSSCRRALAFSELEKARQGVPAFFSYEEYEELAAIATAMAIAATGRPPEDVLVTAHARNYLTLAQMLVERRRDEGRSLEAHRARVVSAWERVHEKLDSAEGARAQTETLVQLGVAQRERLR